MRAHRVSPTTRTLELQQIAALGLRLREVPAPTAEQLGLGGVPIRLGGTGPLSPRARLVRVVAHGDPEFPDLRGAFEPAPGVAPVEVDLHTAALLAISRYLGLRQRWGLSSSPGGT